MSPIGRVVVRPLDAQVVLVGDAARGVVGVVVAVAVAEAFSAAIVGVAEVSWDRDRAALLDVAGGVPDGRGAGVGLGGATRRASP